MSTESYFHEDERCGGGGVPLVFWRARVDLDGLQTIDDMIDLYEWHAEKLRKFRDRGLVLVDVLAGDVAILGTDDPEAIEDLALEEDEDAFDDEGETDEEVED